MVGVSLRLTARSTSQKFRALSKIIAKHPSTPKPLDSMALSFTLVTATCLINFCRMASTGELICMAVRSKIAPAFLLQVMEALVSVWGGNRVAVRIAPGGRWNGMSDSDPDALFDYVAKELDRFGLAYLHIIEPRVRGNVVIAEGQYAIASARLRKIFKGKIIAAGGFEPGTAEEVVEKGDADLVAFGRHFLANPDLPKRIQLGLPLNAYDRNTFYTFDAQGYTDYPFR